MHNNLHDSRRAQLKFRIFTGTYTLQSNRAVFNQFAVDPTCKLCDKSPETRQHFLADCQTLQHVSQKFFTRIQHIVDPSRIDITSPHEVAQLNTWLFLFLYTAWRSLSSIIDRCTLYTQLCSTKARKKKERLQKSRIVAKKSTSRDGSL